MNGSPIAALHGITRLVLAAGHGGKDPGACNGPHREADQAIVITDSIARLLIGAGMPVITAPHQHDTHESIPWINERYKFADTVAIEIHRDSANTIREPDASRRCGVYHGRAAVSQGIACHLVAGLIQAGAVSTSWARPDTASGHGRLGFIRQVQCRSFIMELGFMEGNNAPAHLAQLARMAAAAILETFTGRKLEAAK